MRNPLRPLAVGLLTLTLAACSAQAATQTTAATPTAAASSDQTVATSTVSANDATHDELVAALEANGVPNADRWAAEILEYRPYPVDDPTLQKLQDELAKYNPDPATLSAILEVLEP